MPFKGKDQPIILRLKEGEDLEKAIQRFQAEGYTIPPIDALYQDEDDNSKFIGLASEKELIQKTYLKPKQAKKESDGNDIKPTENENNNKFERTPRFRADYPNRAPIATGRIRTWNFSAKEGIERARREERERDFKDSNWTGEERREGYPFTDSRRFNRR